MKVVIVISGLKGVFYASLEIARRLSLKGTEVVFASSTDLGDRLQPYPFDFQKLPEMGIPKSFGVDFHLPFLQAIDDLKADTYLIDLECPIYVMACIALDQKVLILNHFLPIPTYSDLPIPNRAIIPGEGFSGLGPMVRLSWWSSRSKHWIKAWLQRLKQKSTDRRSLLIQLGKAMGLQTQEFLFSRTLLPGPYLYFSKIPMLHITASELDFEHKLRPTEYYVGPMIFKDRLDPVDSKTVGEIDKVILNAKNRNKKIIYCALSSLKAIEQTFLSKLVEVFRYEEEIQVIVGLGNKSQPPEGSLPENMRFFSWVPMQQILPFADCALISAGFHTIHECISYEVPMLAFSLGTTDQNGFLARIKSKKIGIPISMRSTPQAINMKMHVLLQSIEIKESLRQMKVNFRKYQEQEILEKLLLD